MYTLDDGRLVLTIYFFVSKINFNTLLRIQYDCSHKLFVITLFIFQVVKMLIIVVMLFVITLFIFQVVKMLIIVVMLFVVCWMPLQLYKIAGEFNPDINK